MYIVNYSFIYTAYVYMFKSKNKLTRNNFLQTVGHTPAFYFQGNFFFFVHISSGTFADVKIMGNGKLTLNKVVDTSEYITRYLFFKVHVLVW